MTVEAADVVISGAGPNGLMLACELALAGVRPVVLDKLPAPSDEPKANGLVGQVIRQLDMRGLYHAFGGDEGPPRPTYGWMFAGMPLKFLGVEDNPMYALLLQQPRLVRLLEKRARDLGVDVRWGHELTAMTPGDTSVALTVATRGRAYRMDAAYLVGADGGRSMVCKTAGIDFPGATSPIVSRIAHVYLPEEWLVPGRGYQIPGFGLLGADVPLEAPRKPGSHALRRIDGMNSRQAEHYRLGRVLLVDDAAHVHSPMGGPGLNLGMQDAVNLGWKLVGVVNGWAPAVPDLELDDGRRVAGLLHDARPVLLDGSGGAASAVAAAWSGRVDAVAVGLADGPVAMLIRPDGYVAWAADTFGPDDAERLRASLTRWFGV